MNNAATQWNCAHCGYFSTVRFPGDICPACKQTDWHCSKCGYTLTATEAPSSCIECRAIDSFTNISCYIPDWPMMDDVGTVFMA